MKRCAHPMMAAAPLLLAMLAPAGRAAAKKPLYQTDPVLAGGLRYLIRHQNSRGGWMEQVGPAVTALAVRALLRGGYPADNAAIVKAMKYIESTRQPDGGFYVHDLLQAYNTSIVLSALAAGLLLGWDVSLTGMWTPCQNTLHKIRAPGRSSLA